MPFLYSYTEKLSASALHAFKAGASYFTDQFVYYDKQGGSRLFGLGRCIALKNLDDLQFSCQGEDAAPLFFSFNRFDESNTPASDDLFAVFPQLNYLLPELVLFERDGASYIQVNSLGPVFEGRVRYFKDLCSREVFAEAFQTSLRVDLDSYEQWEAELNQALARIEQGELKKIVLSRRVEVCAQMRFSSVEILNNLIESPAQGVVLLYRYGDVFFCSLTPEILFKKQGHVLESMCLAGTCPRGATDKEDQAHSAALLADEKNLREHAHVVNYLKHSLSRCCKSLDIPDTPQILSLPYISHLYTPVTGTLLPGWSSRELVKYLSPTPALSGTPVGVALSTIQALEPFSRGFFGGACGWVDALDNAEFCVAIRSGVFDGLRGALYAGCGIVAGSDAAAEWEETTLKLKTMISAFERSW